MSGGDENERPKTQGKRAMLANKLHRCKGFGWFARIGETRRGYLYAGPFVNEYDAVVYRALVFPNETMSKLGVEYYNPMDMANSEGNRFVAPSDKHIDSKGWMDTVGYAPDSITIKNLSEDAIKMTVK